MTKVIFKIESDGSTVAFFPSIPGTTSPYTCLSYAHLGQHSSAAVTYAGRLPRAAEDQYADLAEELKKQGYEDLHIVKNFNAGDCAARKRAISNVRKVINP